MRTTLRGDLTAILDLVRSDGRVMQDGGRVVNAARQAQASSIVVV